MPTIPTADSNSVVNVAVDEDSVEIVVTSLTDESEAELDDTGLDALVTALEAALDGSYVDSEILDKYQDTLYVQGDENVLLVGVYDGTRTDATLDNAGIQTLLAAVQGAETASDLFNITSEESGAIQPSARRAAFNESVAMAASVGGFGLTFRYSKTDDSPIETRTLRNVDVFTSQKGDSLIEGTDPDRDDEPRHFRIDRIKGLVQGVE